MGFKGTLDDHLILIEFSYNILTIQVFPWPCFYPVIYVSMLKTCIGDQVSILPFEGLGVDENLSYERVPVKILDRQVKKLRNKEVVSVKVLL